MTRTFATEGRLHDLVDQLAKQRDTALDAAEQLTIRVGKVAEQRDAAISTKHHYEDVARSAEQNLMKATDELESAQEEAAKLREQVRELTEQRNEAQRQALMHEDRAEADRLLAKAVEIYRNGGHALTHGVIVMSTEEHKKLRGDLNEARSERDWWRDAARNSVMRPDVTPSFERNPRNLRGEQILDLIDTIKATGGTVEIHGVKIQRCDERGETY